MSRRLLACSLPPADYARVQEAAAGAGVSVARWVRDAILEAIPRGKVGRPSAGSGQPGLCGQPVSASGQPAGQSTGFAGWEQVFQTMEADPKSAAPLFAQLSRGRNLPLGFKTLTREQKRIWLEREWPL